MTFYDLENYSNDALRTLYAKIQYQKAELNKVLAGITVDENSSHERVNSFDIENRIIAELGKRSVEGRDHNGDL